MRRRIDELAREIESKRSERASHQSSKGGDVQQLEQSLLKRLNLLEDQINDKASKQSVAQALHRKVNKPEFEEIIA